VFNFLTLFTIDRRVLFRFDWLLFSLALLIGVIGIFNLYSAGSSFGASSFIFKKQIYWLPIGLFFLFLGSLLNYADIERYAYAFYLFSLFLLVLVLFEGRVVSGSRRWLSLGFFNFQPSELIKLSLIVVLAKCFQRKYHPKGYGLTSLVFPFFLVATPFFLIFLEPDLGTSLVLLLVFFSIVLFVKIRFTSLSLLVFCAICFLPFSWNLLKEYQKERVIGFLNPQIDPLGKGYQTIQSKIAIGSGRFLGKGFLKGTQTQLDFIPEKYTDFVFSAFCEEWGFLGAMILLSLYFLLFLRFLFIIANAKDSFAMILGYGILALFFCQFVINLGMVLGLLPTVGISLPLFSYGGSSLVVSMFSIGILINIHIQKYIF